MYVNTYLDTYLYIYIYKVNNWAVFDVLSEWVH